MAYILILVLNLVFLVLMLKYIIDIVLVFWGNVFYGVPYVPSKVHLLKGVVGELDLVKGKKMIELGSGDGRIALWFAKNYPIKVLGIEKMGWLFWSSKIRAWLTPFKKGEISFERRDLFKVSLKQFDVVYMYLLPHMIERLLPKLEEMKKSSFVISFDYVLPSKKFLLWSEVGSRKKLRVYKKR